MLNVGSGGVNVLDRGQFGLVLFAWGWGRGAAVGGQWGAGRPLFLGI